MKNNHRIWLAGLIFASTIFYNCTRQPLSTATAVSETVDTAEPERYPNQDSELALLMREMDVDAQKIREAILAGKNFEDFRAKFTKIHTATPTDSGVKTPAYQALATNFLTSLDKVYTAEDKIAGFNLMVNDCLNCHKTTCPGPTVRIKKLSIVK
jgi:hypothetical protein